jgi:hypothetical protein
MQDKVSCKLPLRVRVHISVFVSSSTIQPELNDVTPAGPGKIQILKTHNGEGCAKMSNTIIFVDDKLGRAHSSST